MCFKNKRNPLFSWNCRPLRFQEKEKRKKPKKKRKEKNLVLLEIVEALGVVGGSGCDRHQRIRDALFVVLGLV